MSLCYVFCWKITIHWSKMKFFDHWWIIQAFIHCMCWRPAECLVSEYRTNLSPMGQLYLKSDRAGKPHSPALLLHHCSTIGHWQIVMGQNFISGIYEWSFHGLLGAIVVSADRKYRSVHTSSSYMRLDWRMFCFMLNLDKMEGKSIFWKFYQHNLDTSIKLSL